MEKIKSIGLSNHLTWASGRSQEWLPRILFLSLNGRANCIAREHRGRLGFGVVRNGVFRF